MNILIMTIPVSVTLAILFVLFFLSAVSDDQFDNLETSSHLPLSDDEGEVVEKEINKNIDNKLNIKLNKQEKNR